MLTVTFDTVRKAADELNWKRDAVVAAERKLQEAVSQFLMFREGSMRSLAKEVGLTAAYLCDIIHGRRKVSAEVLKKLEALGADLPVIVVASNRSTPSRQDLERILKTAGQKSDPQRHRDIPDRPDLDPNFDGGA